MWKRKLEAVKFLWMLKHFGREKLEAEANSEIFDFSEEPKAEVFFKKHGAGMWKRKMEAVKFLWKRKHFEEAGSGSKKYSTASTFLALTKDFANDPDCCTCYCLNDNYYYRLISN